MGDNIRYSRISDLLDLVFYMMSKAEGVSLAEIQKRYCVSRRTAERMRDSLLNILPQIDEIYTQGKIKRWGFINYSLAELVSFSSQDISVLEKISQNCNQIQNKEIQNLIAKIKTFNRGNKIKLEDEIEFLMRSEGVAIHQKPNFKIKFENISIIREAIKNSQKLEAIYRDSEKRYLLPLGVIYGDKTYLVAIDENKGEKPCLFLIHKFTELNISDEKFEKPDFDLKEYSSRSFGIYQGEIFDVKLKFSPEVAEDVLNYNFHPTQKVKQKDDGSVQVTFKASGDMQIIWHLVTWGTNVEIVSPKSLKENYKKYLEDILNNFKK